MCTTNQIEVLNDLVKINEEHAHAYQLKTEGPYQRINWLFADLIERKATNISQLRDEVKKAGGRSGDILTGSIYSKWKSLNIKVMGPEPSELLKSSELSEKAAIEAYKSALDNTDMNAAQRFIIRRQYNELLNSIQHIQQLKSEIHNHSLLYNLSTGSELNTAAWR